MNFIERFQKYAEDFEKTYVDDDWTRIAPYFAEDATYEVQGMGAVDGFDRRCDSRDLELTAPPSVDGQTVTIHWQGSYTLDGAPKLEFAGTEEAHYNGGGRDRPSGRYLFRPDGSGDRQVAGGARRQAQGWVRE